MLRIALLCVMTLAASGCGTVAEPTAATSPAPLTPGAVVTGDWSYIYGGNRFTESGEWVHLPPGKPGTCSCGSRAWRRHDDAVIS